MFQIEPTFSLNDDEAKRLRAHADSLLSLWTSTDDNDVDAVQEALVRMYARERCAAPFIVWCDSPWQMHLMPALLDSMKDETRFRDVCSPLSDPITNAFNRALSKANLTWPTAWQARVIQIVGAQRVAQWRESCARARLLISARLQADVENHPDLNAHSFVWGRWAADLLPIYALPALALPSDDWGLELRAQLADLFTLRTGAFGYLFRHCTVFVCKNPTAIHLDRSNRLHCDDGPAVYFADGSALYSWAGVSVDADLVTDPSALTVDRIEREQNVELRRVMIEKYGIVRYLQDTQATVVSEDECGVLLRKDVPGDEPIVLLKVINSTAEQDGSFKTYFLRVPPDMQSPREAVAWTFALNSDEYDPSIET